MSKMTLRFTHLAELMVLRHEALVVWLFCRRISPLDLVVCCDSIKNVASKKDRLVGWKEV